MTENTIIAALGMGDHWWVPLQWRNKKNGKWIFMGGVLGIARMLAGGSVVTTNGFLVGKGSKTGSGLFYVQDDPFGLPDGFYDVEPIGVSQSTATLDPDYLKKQGISLDKAQDKATAEEAKNSIPEAELLKTRMDAPPGWTKQEDGSLAFDDGPFVASQDAEGKWTLTNTDSGESDSYGNIGQLFRGFAEEYEIANASQTKKKKAAGLKKNIKAAKEKIAQLPEGSLDAQEARDEADSLQAELDGVLFSGNKAVAAERAEQVKAKNQVPTAPASKLTSEQQKALKKIDEDIARNEAAQVNAKEGSVAWKRAEKQLEALDAARVALLAEEGSSEEQDNPQEQVEEFRARTPKVSPAAQQKNLRDRVETKKKEVEQAQSNPLGSYDTEAEIQQVFDEMPVGTVFSFYSTIRQPGAVDDVALGDIYAMKMADGKVRVTSQDARWFDEGDELSASDLAAEGNYIQIYEVGAGYVTVDTSQTADRNRKDETRTDTGNEKEVSEQLVGGDARSSGLERRGDTLRDADGNVVARLVAAPSRDGLPDVPLFKVEKGYEAVFRDALIAESKDHPFGASVTIHDLEYYQADDAQLLLTEDGRGGGALKGDEIVSGFVGFGSAASNQQGIKTIVSTLVDLGGRRLDAFDTVLPGIYAPLGFKPVARINWVDEYAPSVAGGAARDWDKETYKKFNAGEPDIVFMAYDPARIGSAYNPSDAPLVSEYDDGTSAQLAAIQEIDSSKTESSDSEEFTPPTDFDTFDVFSGDAEAQVQFAVENKRGLRFKYNGQIREVTPIELIKEKNGNINLLSRDSEGKYRKWTISKIEDMSYLSDYTKVGGQAGSNEGGLYENSAGDQIYIKKAKSDLHAGFEVMASKVYDAAGINAAKYFPGYHPDFGSVVYSPIISGKDDFKASLGDSKYRAEFQEGFMVDAFLANWDSVGLSYDNAKTDENGSPVRIDPGASFLFRAQGLDKKTQGYDFTGEATDAETLRNGKNTQASAVFGDMTPEQLADSAERVSMLSDDVIKNIVEANVTDKMFKEAYENGTLQKLWTVAEFTQVLKDRRDYIVSNYIDAQESIPATSTPTLDVDVVQNARGVFVPKSGSLSYFDRLSLKNGELTPPNLPFAVEDTDSGEVHYYDTNGVRHWGQYGAAGALVRRKNAETGEYEYLVTRRNKNLSTGAGKWSVPAGAHDTLADSQSAHATALRELVEEIGVPDTLVSPAALFSDSDAPDWAFDYSIVDLDGGVDVSKYTADSTEIEDAKWVSSDELRQMQTEGELHDAMTSTVVDSLLQVSEDSQPTSATSSSEQSAEAAPSASDAQVSLLQTLADTKEISPEQSAKIREVLDSGSASDADAAIQEALALPDLDKKSVANRQKSAIQAEIAAGDQEIIAAEKSDPSFIPDGNLIVEKIKEANPEYKELVNGDLVVATKTTEDGAKTYEVVVRRTGKERFFAYMKETDNTTGVSRVSHLGQKENHSYETLLNYIGRGKAALSLSDTSKWFQKKKNLETIPDILNGEYQKSSGSFDDFIEGTLIRKTDAEQYGALIESIVLAVKNDEDAKKILKSKYDGQTPDPSLVNAVISSIATRKILDEGFPLTSSPTHLAYGGKVALKPGDIVDWTDWRKELNINAGEVDENGKKLPKLMVPNPNYGKVYRGTVRGLKPVKVASVKNRNMYTDAVYVTLPEYAKLDIILEREDGTQKVYKKGLETTFNSKQIEHTSANLKIVEKPGSTSDSFYSKMEEYAESGSVTSPASLGVPDVGVADPEATTIPKPKAARPSTVTKSPTKDGQFVAKVAGTDVPVPADNTEVGKNLLDSDAIEVTGNQIAVGDMIVISDSDNTPKIETVVSIEDVESFGMPMKKVTTSSPAEDSDEVILKEKVIPSEAVKITVFRKNPTKASEIVAQQETPQSRLASFNKLNEPDSVKLTTSDELNELPIGSVVSVAQSINPSERLYYIKIPNGGWAKAYGPEGVPMMYLEQKEATVDLSWVADNLADDGLIISSYGANLATGSQKEYIKIMLNQAPHSSSIYGIAKAAAQNPNLTQEQAQDVIAAIVEAKKVTPDVRQKLEAASEVALTLADSRESAGIRNAIDTNSLGSVKPLSTAETENEQDTETKQKAQKVYDSAAELNHSEIYSLFSIPEVDAETGMRLSAIDSNLTKLKQLYAGFSGLPSALASAPGLDVARVYPGSVVYPVGGSYLEVGVIVDITSKSGLDMPTVYWITGPNAGTEVEYNSPTDLLSKQYWLPPTAANELGVSRDYTNVIEKVNETIQSNLDARLAEIKAAKEKEEKQKQAAAQKVALTIHGSGADPVVAPEDVDWETSAIPGTLSLSDALEAANKDKKTQHLGVSVLIDSDEIEDNKVRIQKVTNQSANRVDTRLQFTLTSWAGDGPDGIAAQMLSGADTPTSSSPTWLRITKLSNVDGVLIDTGDVWEGAMVDPGSKGRSLTKELVSADGTPLGRVTIHRANKDSSIPEFTLENYSNASYPISYHNLVQLTIYGDATAEQVQEALSQVGIKNARPATQADIKNTVENMLISTLGGKADGSKNYSKELREATLSDIYDKYGFTLEEVEADFDGHNVEFLLPERVGQMIADEQGIEYLVHGGTYIPDTGEAWFKFLTENRLMSTVDRFTSGVNTGGMSSGSDAKTLGARSTFFSLILKGYLKPSARKKVVLSAAKALRRLNWWVNTGDDYGIKRNQNQVKVLGNAHEFMMKGSPSWDMISHIHLPAKERLILIEKLHQIGITHIGGVPIEDVIEGM